MPVLKKKHAIVEDLTESVGTVQSVIRDITYYIRPTRAGFYAIFTSKGSAPDALSGLYTSIQAGFEAIKKHENGKPQSRSAIRRDVQDAKKET